MPPALSLPVLAALAGALQGCQTGGAVFVAETWIGILGVLLVIAIIGFVASRMRR
ncbi:MAG TPA: hypothetical protein VIG68_08490 [Lysobacter sp.]